MNNVKIFKGYYNIIYISFGLILFTAALISYFQLTNHIAYEKTQIKRHLQNNISRLEGITNVVHNHLRDFKDNLAFYLENERFTHESPLIKHIQDFPDHFYHLDSIPSYISKDEMLTISGSGAFEPASPKTRFRANVILNLAPLFASIHKHTPSTVLTYYFSWNEQFAGIYPYLASHEFHINSETFENASKIYNIVFPAQNPEGKICWTEAYPDDVGRGLMVTAVIPIFKKDDFEGIFGIDFTLDSLNQIISQNQKERGTIFLSNTQHQLLAHPNLVNSFNEKNMTLKDALPDEIKSKVQEITALKEQELHQVGNYWIIYENIKDTPWHLTYVVNYWDIYLDTLFDIGVIIAFSLISISLVLLLTAIYTQKRFIKPAGQLVQHIQNESQGQASVSYQQVPNIWREWFHIISQIFQKNREMIWELRKNNDILEMKVQERTEEIATQNEELIQNQEEILSQRNYVESQNKELERINEKLQHNQKVLQKAYEKLREGQLKISSKNKELEERDRLIRSSINAALSIQTAILPYPHRVKSILGDYFIIYKPKDVVSGDFYWINKVKDSRVIVTADCTGHGVPGALMSMIGNTILDKVISLQQHINPSQILEEVHKEVSFALKQEDTHNNYGMDMSVLVLQDYHEGLTLAKYAGAKTSLFFKSPQEEEVVEIRGSRRAIGGIQNLNTPFDTHDVMLMPGSHIYMGSDGYVDQNDKHRKRFGEKAFRNLLLEITSQPLLQQRIILEEKLAEHMTHTQQRDDILILGFQI